MHSNKMRTVRFGGHLWFGGCLWSGGLYNPSPSNPPVTYPLPPPPSPVNRMTYRCKNLASNFRNNAQTKLASHRLASWC